MQFDLWNSTLTVDLDAICGNAAAIGRATGAAVIPVLKSNAYGCGAVAVARALCAASPVGLFAMAQVREGAELRQAGIASDVLLLSGTPLHLMDAAVEHRLTPTVFSPDSVLAFAAAVRRAGQTAYPVHLKVETGLNRLGVRPGAELAALLTLLCRTPELRLAGTYSHFVSGEQPGDPLAQAQAKLFMEAVAQIRAVGIDPGMLHLCNSGGSEWFADAFLDAVRIGRRLYMGSPEGDGDGDPAIREAVSWRCTVTNVRHLGTGERLGYNHHFTAERPTDVATLCVGYGDGLYPDLCRAGAPVLVRGERAHLIGCCMDQSFLDVTGIPCAPGDTATFFGTDATGAFLSAQEVAGYIHDEGVFLTNGLTPRVGRRYLSGADA